MKRQRMGPPIHVRMLRTVKHLLAGGTITSDWIAREFQLHPVNARRDMRTLRSELPLEMLSRRANAHIGSRATAGKYKRLRLSQPA